MLLCFQQKGMSLSNVALKGIARQSSTHGPATASRAIDGNRDSEYDRGSCSHTQLQTAPWWTVELDGVYKVVVTNRNVGPERLDGAEIHVGIGANNPR